MKFISLFLIFGLFYNQGLYFKVGYRGLNLSTEWTKVVDNNMSFYSLYWSYTKNSIMYYWYHYLFLQTPCTLTFLHFYIATSNINYLSEANTKEEANSTSRFNVLKFKNIYEDRQQCSYVTCVTWLSFISLFEFEFIDICIFLLLGVLICYICNKKYL